MKIVKINKTDGRLETKGCIKSFDEIIKQFKDIWLSENFKKLWFSC